MPEKCWTPLSGCLFHGIRASSVTWAGCAQLGGKRNCQETVDEVTGSGRAGTIICTRPARCGGGKYVRAGLLDFAAHQINGGFTFSPDEHALVEDGIAVTRNRRQRRGLRSRQLERQ